MIFTFTLGQFWPTILVVPSVAMIGFSIFFFRRLGADETRWVDRVLAPVLFATVCSAAVSVTANLVFAGVIAAFMAGIVGVFWIGAMLIALSYIPTNDWTVKRG